MGSILSSKATKDGRIVFEVLMDYDEALQLRGHVNNVHMFSEEETNTEANISERGKFESTKYFLIPKELRKNLRFNSKVMCQRIETPKHIAYIYLIDKLEI